MSFAALNCLLQIEQVNSESDDSDDDPLAQGLYSLRFHSASQTPFALEAYVLFLMRRRRFALYCAVCS